MRVDAALPALPALAAMAGAVGDARRIVIKRGRAEPAVLWCAVVGKSGSGKTPAADLVLAPLRKMHGRLLREHARDMADHDADRLRHERDLAGWKKSGEGEPPESPEPPPQRRVLVDDTTTEG